MPFFSGVPTFSETFSCLSVELQKGNPSTGANVRDVNSVRRCVVCVSAPGLFWKTSPPLLPPALIPFPGPWCFLQRPEAQHIWPSGHQATKQWWTATTCTEFLQRHVVSPLTPQFLLSWMFALSYFSGELCYLHKMWPGLAQECLQQHAARLTETS